MLGWRKCMSIITILLIGIAIFSFIYMFIIICYVGIQAAQLWLWPAIGVSCLAVSILDYYVRKGKHPFLNMFEIGIVSIGVIATIGIIILEVIILSFKSPKMEGEPDYVLVLGARVRGTVVSKALVERLDCAVAYEKEHPTCTIIVSGGKGPGEDVTEAFAMKQYLVEHGIKPERIVEEDQSTDTAENFQFSMEKISDKDATIVVISNRFHVYRAVSIGKKMGINNLYGEPAVTDPIMRVHYYLREAIAVFKYKLKGTI